METSKNIFKGTGISLLVTFILLIIFSAILTYTNISENTITPVILIITAISILIGSSIGNMNAQKNGILNGALVGGSYILILYFISSLLNWKFSLNLQSIIMIIATYVQRICTNKVINHLAKEGRTIAFKSVERLPLSVFESEPAGKTASRITQDVDGLITLYRLLLNVFFNAMLSFVFAYIGMFILNPKLALLSFIIYPLAALWIFIYLKYLKKIAVKVNETRSLITAKINEIINGIQILQIFNFKKQTIDEFNVISKNYKD